MNTNFLDENKILQAAEFLKKFPEHAEKSPKELGLEACRLLIYYRELGEIEEYKYRQVDLQRRTANLSNAQAARRMFPDDPHRPRREKRFHDFVHYLTGPNNLIRPNEGMWLDICLKYGWWRPGDVDQMRNLFPLWDPSNVTQKKKSKKVLGAVKPPILSVKQKVLSVDPSIPSVKSRKVSVK